MSATSGTSAATSSSSKYIQVSSYTGDAPATSGTGITVPGQTTIVTSNNLCLGVKGSIDKVGTIIEQEPCTGNPNQQWIMNEDTGSISTALPSGSCIQSNNGTMQLYSCSQLPSQYFNLQSNGEFVNPISYGCLDTTTGLANVPVQMATCSGSTSQQFSLGNPPTIVEQKFSVAKEKKSTGLDWKEITIIVLSVFIMIVGILAIFNYYLYSKCEKSKHRN